MTINHIDNLKRDYGSENPPEKRQSFDIWVSAIALGTILIWIIMLLSSCATSITRRIELNNQICEDQEIYSTERR